MPDGAFHILRKPYAVYLLILFRTNLGKALWLVIIQSYICSTLIGSARESKFIAIVATINPDFHNLVLHTESFKLYLSIRFIIATPFKTY